MINAISRFAVLDIEQIPLKTGYEIIATTDVPCHLFLRLTNIKPQEHIIPRMSRGLQVFDDKYFCFVVYEDNEQEEPGDTLTHTFVKENWPICQTRYFYFHGTIGGVASLSTTAIITKHRVLPDEWRLIKEPWTLEIPPPPDMTSLINELWTQPPPWPPTWVFHEPWGTSLTENYHWILLSDPDPPGIDLTDGILTLTFTATPHSGIIWNAPVDAIPLQSDSGQPLHIFTSNPGANKGSPVDTINNMVLFRKDGQFISLYLLVTHSPVGWGSGDYGYENGGPHYRAWLYIGEGIHDVDLLAFFQRAAADLGIDTDPTGWFVNLIEITHRDLLPIGASFLKNDYLYLYYSPWQKLIEEPWTL